MSKSCIIIGGGNSVNDGLALGLWDKINAEEIWSVNFTFMAMPYIPSKQLWIDLTFFKNNIDRLEKLYKCGVECITKKHVHYDAIDDIVKYDVTREQYFGTLDKPLYVSPMGLSGIFSLSVAVARGYDTIYLLGYDFGTPSISNANTHFYLNQHLDIKSHGLHKPDVYRTQDNNVKKDVKCFDNFLKSPCKIYNVSAISNIQSFEKIDYPTFFNKISQKTI